MTLTSLPIERSTRRRWRITPPTGTIGLDIGSQSLKIVQLETVAGMLRPRICRAVPHECPLDPSGPEQCAQVIERTMRRLWSSRHGWSPIPAACVLSMSLMTFRTFELPVSEEAEAPSPSALEGAFLADVDTPATSWSLDCWPTQNASSGRATRSYAGLGIDVYFAELLSELLWRTGLDCRILDGLPFAIARAAAEIATTEPVAVIDWGDSAMTLTLVIDGRPGFTRTLRGAELRTLTSAMQRALELDADQCRPLLEAYGFGRSEQSVEANSMSAVLAEISAPYLSQVSEQLRRTWDYLHQLPGQTPKQTLLMGGGATVKGAAAVVRAAFPVPTDIWTIPGSDDQTTASFGPAWALARLSTKR